MAQAQIDLDDLDKFIAQVITHLQTVKIQIQNETYPKPNYFYNFGGNFRNLRFGVSILLTNDQEISEEFKIFMDQFGRPLEGTFKEI